VPTYRQCDQPHGQKPHCTAIRLSHFAADMKSLSEHGRMRTSSETMLRTAVNVLQYLSKLTSLDFNSE
jgi:hypothetical protein